MRFVGVYASLVIGLSASAVEAQQPTGKPAELKVLEKFVGAWDSETIAKPAVWTLDGEKSRRTNTYEWALDGRFLQYSEFNEGERAALGWWTYDASTKLYRGWFFQKDGVVEWRGQWDEKNNGLRVEADLGDIRFTGVNRFPDDDTYEWTFVAKDKAGKVHLDAKATHRRRRAFAEPANNRDGISRPHMMPHQMRVLDKYSGSWSNEFTNRAAAWNPKETLITGTAMNAWVLGGSYMQIKVKSSTGAEAIQMRIYDPQKKQFRAWVFDARGGAASSTGVWDDKTETFTWKGTLKDGVTGTHTVRFAGADVIDWTMVARDDSKVVLNMDGKLTRNGTAVFDRFAGVWKSHITDKPAKWQQQGGKRDVDEHIMPVLKDRFILGREVSRTDDVKSLWLMTYDPQEKTYPLWYFNTNGVYGGEWVSTWSEFHGTLTGKATDTPAGWTSQGINHLIDRDRGHASTWMKDDAGTLLFDTTMRKTRQDNAGAAKVLADWSKEQPGKLPPELKVLERLIGTWDVEATAKVAEWTPKEIKTTSAVVRKWVLDGHFLQDISKVSDGSEGMSLLTYDPRVKAYRSWWFSSEGHRDKSTGAWDPATQVMEFKSEREGKTTHATVRFIDADRHVWRVRTTDGAGKVYFDGEWRVTRQKKR